MSLNKPNTSDSIDTKIKEGGKDIGTGLGDVISGACTTLCKTLGAGVNLLGAGISKVQEHFCDETDKDLKKSRENITKSRIDKAKKKGKHALKSVGTTIGGGLKTVKGTGKVAIHSVRKTVKDIKNDEIEK